MRHGACALLAVILGVPSHATAQTVMVTGGVSSTRMQPSHLENSAVEFVSRRATTLGIRGEAAFGSYLTLIADACWAPRGGGVSFRQTYGFFGDYVEFSGRLGWHTPGRVQLTASSGPVIAVRVRDRTGSSLFDGPDGHDPAFGPLSAVEFGGLVTAGVKGQSGKRVVEMAEIRYLWGGSNLHQPGSSGTTHDPHVFDFRGTSRTLSVVVGLGIDLSR